MGSLKSEPFDGLGSHVYLEKQDKLREIGVDIPTSQIVVVGSQSAGKSSLLENLTGFAFPRGQGLCTRYATQITLRRSPVKSTVISIIPWSDSNQDRRDRLRAFRYEQDNFDGAELAQVIDRANSAMGIRSGSTQNDASLPMFSDDILKVEVSGPDKPHLTVIDVPGLFQVTDEGVTTDLDRLKVENMVRRYMENERTIVLAVLSCLSDRATEGVLQLAKQADPEGIRTVGVLTKADLVKEQAVVQTLLQLVKGNTLKLGYYIVRNRGADEDSLTVSECQMKEKEKFAEPLWAELAKFGRTGVGALRAELQTLLTELARRELPKQRAEVEHRLSESGKKLRAMGPPRDSSASQRECLVKLASQCERIVRDALDGRYEGSPIFSDKPGLKLATKIIDLNEGFSELIARKGHSWEFRSESEPSDDDESNDSEVPEEPLEYEDQANAIRTSASSIPELQHLVREELVWREPPTCTIMRHIEKYYKMSRGPELGTFGGSLLAMTFRAQASNWRTMVMAHVETVIVAVHQFMRALLDEVVGDQQMREALWGLFLLDKIQATYLKAKEQAEFLLSIELDGRPSTYNHYFNDNLQIARSERLKKSIEVAAIDTPNGNLKLKPAALLQLATNKSNAEQVKEDIHDILQSYYKVSRKRFVDVICRVVIEHFLLDGSGSPLKVFSPELVTRMTDAQLDMIAGEDATTKRERERLVSEIQGLKAAMKVLSG